MPVMDVPAEFQPLSPLYPRDSAADGGGFERYIHKSGVLDVPGMLYVPIYWTAMSPRHFPRIQNWLWPRLDPRKQYCTTIVAGGYHWTDRPENLLAIGATATDDIVIPYVQEPSRGCEVIDTPKTRQINFIGTINRHTDYKGVRTRSVSQLPPDSIVHVNKGKSNEVPMAFDDYLATVAACKYTLAPRGYDSSSYRVFEALAVGSIPVYIWLDGCALPFNHRDDVDWDSFAVVAEDPWDGTLPDRSVEAGRDYYNRYCRPEELVQRIREELLER